LFTAPKNYKTQIFIENSNGLQKIEIDEENHFTKILIYFKEAIESKELKIQEYNQNIQQAILISQFKKIINER
jgi:hypothetical protein